MTLETPAFRLARAEAHYRDLIQRRLRATKRLSADLAPNAVALAAHSPKLAEAVAAVQAAITAEEAELRQGRAAAALGATEAAMEQLMAAIAAEGLGDES